MKTVWVNGCFDVLHRGHVQLLRYAASLGDKLIVAIDSDKKVKLDKGPTRPYNSQEDRKYFLESIRYVDEVLIFNSKDELKNLIKLTSPDIMVVGSDWKGKEIVGGQHSKEIKYFNRIDNFSTTNILQGKKQ
tara:strand:+ start:1233 stop:1628 length:396 start_codon:yes stop_codon:yes gene_type:complete